MYSALPVTAVTGMASSRPPSPSDGLIHGFNLTTRSLQIPAQSTVASIRARRPAGLTDGYHGVAAEPGVCHPLETTVFVDGDPVDDPTLSSAGLHNLDP